MPFEKNSSWHVTWALVKIECLIVKCQETLCPEISIRNWVVSGIQSHKVECVQQHFIVTWKWPIWDQVKVRPEIKHTA